MQIILRHITDKYFHHKNDLFFISKTAAGKMSHLSARKTPLTH